MHIILVIFLWNRFRKKAHCEVVLVVWDLIIGRSIGFIFLSLGVSCSSCAMGLSSKLDLNLTVGMHFVSKLFDFSSNTLLVGKGQIKSEWIYEIINFQMTWKFWRISALIVFTVHRVEIFQISRVIFWKVDDFTNPFWLNLTFSVS